MANQKDIRKRIQSVKNTRQITRAMKLVAAAKLRRAQEAIMNARPYAYRIYSILLELAQGEEVQHPLLVKREEKRAKVVILAGDRGLCGSFNASIFKKAAKFLDEKKAEGVETVVECIGKKAYEFFKTKVEVQTYHEGLIGDPAFSHVSEIASEILKNYAEEHFDATYLIYNEFKSAIQQKAVVEKLIPVSTEVPDGVVGIREASEQEKEIEYIFEPNRKEILKAVVPRHFQTQLFRAVLESVAAEHGARMSAMESATKNATEMLGALTLEYNKARQAAITQELMEIVSGVEAMR